MSRFLQEVTIPAAAGGRAGVAVVNFRASVFHCVAATADFEVATDNQKPAAATAGRGFGTPEKDGGRPWTKATLINTSGVAITTTIYMGLVTYSGEQIIAGLAVTVNSIYKDAPTYTKATVCTAGNTTTFNGLDGTKQRKQFICWNDEPIEVSPGVPGQNLTIQDNASVNGGRVAPQTSFAPVSNGVFKVVVPPGAEDALVLETFYV